MISKSSRRPGFGNNFGSLNVPVHVGDTAPSNPVNKQLWFDITTSPGVWKYYDLATVTWIA
jgi:hypothetical protein